MKRAMLAVGCAAMLGLAGAAHAAPAETRQYLFIDYSLTQHVHSAVDDREIYTTVSLVADRITVEINERVLGATTPVVKETHYHSDPVLLTRAQETALAQALTDAGIGRLKSDAGYNDGYDIRFAVHGPGHDYDYEFGHPVEDDAGRAAVVKALFDFVRQLSVDTSGPGAVSASEGDTVAPRPVTLAELIAHPELYDGKRVSVAGYFHWEFEGSNFCVTPGDVARFSSATQSYAACLWMGEPSSFADPAALIGHNDDWERVDGLFVKGPGGHMGLWPGEIVRLTRAETTLAPK